MANQYEPNGGRQVGGGPERSDRQAGGGSSGTGGYGKIQDRIQGREEQGDEANVRRDPQLDRGEAFDEEQGGGRDDQSLSSPGWTESQGAGGGLESQMHQRERGGLSSDETERDAES